MKLLKEHLLPAVNALMPIAGKRTTLPILNCIRLEGDNGHLSLRASNLDCDATFRVECKGKLPPVCVPARALHTLVSGGAETISLEPEEKNRLVVESGGTARLACLEAKDFVANPDQTGKAIGANPTDLARAIKSVVWGATRYVVHDDKIANDLDFVFVFVSAKSILCVGTDRRSFAFCHIPAIGADCEFQLPTSQASAFVTALLADDDAQLHLGEKHASVRHKGGEVYVRLSDAAAPPVKKAFELPREPIGEIELEPFRSEISKCCALSANQFAPVTLSFSKSGLKLAFNGGAHGYDTTLAGDFKDLEIKLDAFRLDKALREMATEKVKISRPDTALSFESGELLATISILKF